MSESKRTARRRMLTWVAVAQEAHDQGGVQAQALGVDAGAVYFVPGPVFGVVNLDDHARVTGASPGDQAGVWISGAGDPDNDGFDDVMVGAWHADDGGADSGAVYLIYGGAL